MTTDMERYWNLIRLLGRMVEGMTVSLHEMFEEAAMATMNDVGKRIAEIMETDMGLVVGGDTPQGVLEKLGPVFKEEMGMVQTFDMTSEGNKIEVKVTQCLGWDLRNRIASRGVPTSIHCPVMNVGHACLRRMGYRVKRSIQGNPESTGCTITYEIQ